MPLTPAELTELKERRRIDFLEKQLQVRTEPSFEPPPVPAVSTATTLAEGEIPQPRAERGLLEPVPVKSITDIGAIAQNIPKFVGRVVKAGVGIYEDIGKQSSQEMELKKEAFYYYKSQGVEDREAYDLAQKTVEESFPKQTTGQILGETGSMAVGIPGLKEAYHRPLSVLEKPENILQPLGILLGGKKLLTSKFPALENLSTRLDNAVARYTTQPLAKGTMFVVQKFAGKIYNKAFGTLRHTDPELLSMLRSAAGEKTEFIQQIEKGAQALEQTKGLIAQKLDVEKMAAEGLSPEQITAKVQRITELRAGQLAEQPTVPFGKLAGGEVPKAGITSNVEVAQNIQLYQSIQVSLTKQLLKQKNADGTPMLDPETAWHTIGGYLHRIYQLEPPTTKRGIFPFRKHKLGLTELKGRGKSAVQFEETKWQAVINQSQKELVKTELSLKQRKMGLHGSPIADLTEIKPSRSNYGSGVNFTTDEAVALHYSRGRKNVADFVLGQTDIEPQAGIVYKLNIQPRRPLLITGKRQYEKLLAEHGDTDLGIGQWAKREGFDAIFNDVNKEHIIFTDKPARVSGIYRTPELQKQIAEAQRMKDWASERVDIPYEIRQKELNQVNDPTTRFVIGGLKTASDITNARLFEKIATDPNRVTDFPHKNWIKAGETKTWGQLAGKYIEPTTYREVFDLMSQSEQWNKSYQAILSLIKKNLTVRNPATQFANYTYNIIGSYFADVSTLEYSLGIKDMLRGIDTPIFKELLKSGRLEETWTSAELAPILQRFYGILDTKQPLGVQIPRIIDHFTEESLGKIPFFSSKYYQAIDTGLKWAIYKKGRLNGLTHEEALKPVDLYTQDYKNLPPIIKSLRKTGVILFPSFFAENIRILKNVAINQPIKFITTMSAPFAITEIMQRGQNITDDEMKAAKQAMPWWTKIGWHVWLPIRNEDGTITLNDASYLLGFTSIANFTDVRSLAQNPIFTTSAEMIGGKDLETGRDIIKPEQKPDPIKIGRVWADRMLRSVQGAPYRIPSSALKMLQGQPDITGHVETYGEFITRMFSPVKEYPIRQANKKVAGSIGSFDLQLKILKGEIDDLRGRFVAIQSDYRRGKITLLERDNYMENIKQLIREQKEKIDLFRETKKDFKQTENR